jgi:DNA ligase (NAD+)
VIQSIVASKERTLDRLLTGLGIEHVGQVAAKQLAEGVGSLEALLEWKDDDVAERVRGVSGFGPKMVESVRAFLADPRERALLERLRDRGVSRPQPKHETAVEGPLLGLSFCVTGVLSRRREDVHADIRKAGGEVHDKVKKGTSYLVAGDKVGKAKLDGAKKFGAKIIGEAELAELLQGASA